MSDFTVLVVDDHAAVREGLRRALEAHGVCVVAEAGTGADALAAVAELCPDVVLLDVSLPDLDGVEVARRLRGQAPGTRVVMLTMYTDRATVSAALAAGAAAYLPKDCTTAQIVGALTDLVESGTVRTATTCELLGQRTNVEHERVLSQRELEVLQLVAEGASTSEVAERLYISAKTAKNHLANIYEKLDAGDRTQAVVQALRLGLIRLR